MTIDNNASLRPFRVTFTGDGKPYCSPCNFTTLEQAIRDVEESATRILRAYPYDARRERVLEWTIETVSEHDVEESDIVNASTVEVRTFIARLGAHGREGHRATIASWFALPREPIYSDEEEGDERKVQDAIGIIQRETCANARGIAVNLLKRVADRELTSSESFQEALHEDCDGDQSVIYNARAERMLFASSNSDAYREATGEKEDAELNVRAYYCLRADVEESVGAMLPVDIGDEPKALDARTIRILSLGGPGGAFDVNDDETYPSELADADSVRETIVEHCARMLSCLAWASAVDLAREIGGTDAPNLSGCDIMEHAPETSDVAKSEAERIVASIERANEDKCDSRTPVGVQGRKLDIGAWFLEYVLPVTCAEGKSDCGPDDLESLAERFGGCMAYESLGHGVAWTDDYPSHELKIGHAEHMEMFRFEVADAADEEAGTFKILGGSHADTQYNVVDVDGTFYVEVEGVA